MTDPTDPKVMLKRHLQSGREALLWKLEGLSERDARLPRTPTGTNLLGIVKHALNVEAGYFGETFGRAWPTPQELVQEEAFDTDPQADWYATPEETKDGLVDLYRRVWTFCDETIDTLPLEAPGHVPWWGERGAVTLHQVLLHVIADLTRHAGHADILREQLDGSVGLRAGNTNIPEGTDWPGYVARLREIAERFG